MHGLVEFVKNRPSDYSEHLAYSFGPVFAKQY